MPQLDKVTFLSQFFWLSFFYLGFYFLILKFFLPKMSRILKLRKKKMSGSQEGVGFLAIENEKVRNNFDSMLAKSLNTSRNFFTENYQRTTNWLDDVRFNTNQTHYQNVNKAYIQSVGESSLADNLALTQASSKISEKLFTQLLLSKLK
jgi:hypothetical protein